VLGKQALPGVQTQLRFPFSRIRPMALKAIIRKDRANIAGKIDWLGIRRVPWRGDQETEPQKGISRPETKKQLHRKNR
jgi:hypothetical protein